MLILVLSRLFALWVSRRTFFGLLFHGLSSIWHACMCRLHLSSQCFIIRVRRPRRYVVFLPLWERLMEGWYRAHPVCPVINIFLILHVLSLRTW